MSPDTSMIIGLVIALVATVFLYVAVMPKSKNGRLPSFAQFIHNYFHFKQLYIEVVLKFFFTLLTFACVFCGLFLLCVRRYYSELRGIGVALMLLGPVALRFVYEMFMMFILLVQNVIDINKKLGAGRPGPSAAPVAPAEPAAPAEPVAPAEPAPPVEPVFRFCGSCGARYDASQTDV